MSESNGLNSVSKWVLAAVGSIILAVSLATIKTWIDSSREIDIATVKMEGFETRIKTLEKMIPSSSERLTEIHSKITEIATTQRDILRRLDRMEETN